MEETNRICPWCSTPIPSSATACPTCHALVEGAVAEEIPGLTVVDPKATAAPGQGLAADPAEAKDWLRAGNADPPVNLEAILPPSDAVRKEMRKIELETEIENAGSVVMNPTGDESRDAGAPSIEAIEAYEAGLLDETGPAGETDLGELAAPWEDPELEKRVAMWKDATGDKKPE